MENVFWNKACLRISSYVMNTSEITDIIGLSPSHSYEKGELISQRNPNSQKRENSLWIIDSGLSDNDNIETHLEKLISKVENKLSELLSLEGKCEMDIFCGISLKGEQHSLLLSSEIIKKISILPLDIVLDLYSE